MGKIDLVPLKIVAKYVLHAPVDGVCTVNVQDGRVKSILSTDHQDGRLVVWAETELVDGWRDVRQFLVVNTERPFERPEGSILRFVGTVQVPSDDGNIVWHVFEIAPS